MILEFCKKSIRDTEVIVVYTEKLKLVSVKEFWEK